MKREMGGRKEGDKEGRKEEVYVFLFMPPSIAHKQYALLTSLSNQD